MPSIKEVKNVLIIALFGAIVFSAVRMLMLRSVQVTGFENSTEIFRGYGAFLDRRINYENVQGWGMSRTLNDNDIALWVEVKPHELAVGDIIIYSNPSNPGKLIAHRIVEIQQFLGSYTFKTKGDNISQPDDYWVGLSGDLKGIVIGVIYYRVP
ncbi:MAG: signal peptidase I [Candidatus Hadarchaeota archaeon]